MSCTHFTLTDCSYNNVYTIMIKVYKFGYIIYISVDSLNCTISLTLQINRAEAFKYNAFNIVSVY